MLTTGMPTSTPTTSTANPVSPHRTHAGSVRGFTKLAGTCGPGPRAGSRMMTASALMTDARAFEEVDDHQHGERDHQQHDGDRGRLAVGELLEARHDQDRRDLGLVGHVAGHEDDRAVLADPAREREGE